MKTIYGIVSIVLIAFVMLFGINEVLNHAGSLGNLDEESIALVAVYDDRLVDINDSFGTIYVEKKDQTTYEPNSNLAGDEFKEYFEHKNRIQQLYDVMEMAYKFPDLVFLSLPFVDLEDTVFYRNIVWFLIWVSIFIAVILALRNGIITEEQK